MECGPCYIDKDSPIPTSSQMFQHLINMFVESEAIITSILNAFDVAPDRRSFLERMH